MDKSKRGFTRRAFLFTALSGLVALLAPRHISAAPEYPGVESFPPLPTRGAAPFELPGCVVLREVSGGAC